MQEPIKTRLGKNVSIRRLVTGLWQMADQERDGKPFDLDAAANALHSYARAGFDTFDMADHYGSAEIIAGMVHKAMRKEGENPPTIMTKWCPKPGEMSAVTVRKGIETALNRLELDTIDVMQFHWWRYESPEYLDALFQLMRLREEGLIREIGLTNFDSQHLRMVIKNGIEIASNQVCFSLLDRRAAGELSKVAQDYDVAILAFGTLAGGFLSERWIKQQEPDDIRDWSRMKYKRYIDAAGGWTAFQALLRALDQVARKHNVSITNIATAWALDQTSVRATIIGARLTEGDHRIDNLRAQEISLDDSDRASIQAVTDDLLCIPGDCGDEYRKPPFLTASGDLSHHLDTLPSVFDVVEVRPGRKHTDSGTMWEKRAGFSRALRDGNRILVSGTTATDASGNVVCEGDAEGQTVYILDKILATIHDLGGTLEDLARTRIFLRNTSDWESVSGVHARYFGDLRPTNTLVGGLDLVGPYLVEIEAEAIVQK
jgi:aryl-alcohol dehydrogenase-like predicted oxidoreductase/enamine deaminase RidA (YjgF/YER057c/UK114 family)